MSVHPHEIAPPPTSQPRPMFWSIRREVWENRSIYVAPLSVTAIVLFAFVVSTFSLRDRMRGVPALEPAKQHAAIVTPFSMAPAAIIFATFLVGFFYCTDALQSERRDRSILFWKSLPVSDRTTVLSKASIPIVVLPAIAIALGLTAQFLMLIWGSLLLLGDEVGPARLWSEFKFVTEAIVMVYGVTAHALWWAPIFAWLLLISAWARRATLLWAVLPMIAIAMIERIVFNTAHFNAFMKYRWTGAMTGAFNVPRDAMSGGVPIVDQIWQLTPARFLTSPGLWTGLAFAAICLGAAIRLRRSREPM